MKMKILLTNDDGPQSPGMAFLFNHFKKNGHEVYVVVPNGERSGSSHSLTFGDSVRLLEEKRNRYILNGTPADCVHMALLGIIKQKIDVVVSGINLGPNLGIDIVYSGTVAAAREAALSGVRGIALSINKFRPPFQFELAEVFLKKHFKTLISHSNCSFIFNVNFPAIDTDRCRGVVLTRPGRREYRDKLVEFTSPYQGRYYWIGGEAPTGKSDPGTDMAAIDADKISVTPLKILPEAVGIGRYGLSHCLFK